MVKQYRKVYNFAIVLLLLIIIRSGFLAEIKWSISMSKSHWICVTSSWTTAGFIIIIIIILIPIYFGLFEPTDFLKTE